jgi:deoxyribose-phosphate aldolase
LKTADQAGLDEKDNVKVTGFIQEAIDEHFKLIMIRPDMVAKMVSDASSNLQIGTVIDFPGEIQLLLINYLRLRRQFRMERTIWIMFVITRRLKNGDIDLVKEEVLKGTQLGIENNKVVNG